ncbi:hypothetical protein R1flu_020917 [Riccia fluitans]|uniref:Uncharacterized protein n=1 Tax=Riccia fluitans TaxID=41844 RepID=A0ABD1ZRK5_9MARC
MPEEVDEAVLSKLLIHKVPKGVRYEELKLLFPRNIHFKFQEIEKGTSATSKYFSTYAVFPSKEVANEAFDQLRSPATEDTTGRLQKIVNIRSRFQHRNASCISVIVRKMDNSIKCLDGRKDTAVGDSNLVMETKCFEGVETAEDSNLAIAPNCSQRSGDG